MLGDLEGIFRDVFRDHIRPEGTLPQGSVILVGSLSHLSLLGLSPYVEDLVRCCNLLISLTGPGVTICPLVPVPLSGISEIRTIVDLANFDSWLSSNKIAANFHLPSSRNIFWESLCSSSSSFGASHACKLSALLAASLETKFLKLPTQSQTPDAAEDLADKLCSFELTGNDIVYLAFHLTRFTWARMMKVIAMSPLRITKKNGTFQEAWWQQPNRGSEKCWTGSLPFGRPAVPQR